MRASPVLLLPMLLLLAGCGGSDLNVAGTPPTVQVSPKSVVLSPGASTVFSAKVLGLKDQSITWSALDGGSFSGKTGVYTAPITPGTYAIVAASGGDPSRADLATVLIPQPISVAVTPSSVTLVPGGTQLFGATVTGGSSQGVTWAVVPATAGSFQPTGGSLYTAPAYSGTFMVTATSTADPLRIGTATVNVVGPITVTVSPAQASLLPGDTKQFTATVAGAAVSTATWSVVEPGGGTIAADGTYIAPATPGSYTVKATADAAPSVSGTAQVLVGALTFALSPTAVTLDLGATQLFTPRFTGTAIQTVSWSLDGGTPSAPVTGPYVYTATASGSHALKATATASTGLVDIASILVNPVVITSISPANAVLPSGGTVAFSATLTGCVNPAVTWSVKSGGAGGSIDTSGVYIAPLGAGTDIIQATSVADPTVVRRAIVSVGSIAISPSNPPAISNTTGAIFFSATVSGVPDPGVTWSILPAANGGTINSAGYLTAPTLPGTYRIRATSILNPALFAEVKVSVS